MATPDQPARSGLSRRTFLKAGTAGAGLAALHGCVPPDGSPNQLPPLATPTGDDDAAWSHVRERFMLEPGMAYMNNSSLGMPPADVVRAVADGYEAISREPLHGKHALQETIAERVAPGLAPDAGHCHCRGAAPRRDESPSTKDRPLGAAIAIAICFSDRRVQCRSPCG